jgi:hypothetical protein
MEFNSAFKGLINSTVKPSFDTSQAVTRAANENVSVSEHIKHNSDSKESQFKQLVKLTLIKLGRKRKHKKED